MTDPIPLLVIATQDVCITMSSEGSRHKQGADLPPGRLSVTSSSDVPVVQSIAPDAAFGLWEQTDYLFTAESRKPGVVPRVTTSSIVASENIKHVGQSGVLAGNINFGSDVGICTISIAVGDCVVSVVLEVFPSKLDYVADYISILRDLSERNSSLIFRYLEATTRLVGTSHQSGEGDVHWLSILRSYIDELQSAMALVDGQPILQLKHRFSVSELHRIRRVAPSTLSAVHQGKGSGPWTGVGGVAMRQRLPTQQNVITNDGPEHRWILGQLRSIATGIRTIRNRASIASVQRGHLGVADRRALQFLGQLRDLEQSLDKIQRLSVFEGVTLDYNVSSPPSLALLTRHGYGETYRLLGALTSSLALGESGISASVSNIALLYEQWCYFQVIDTVREYFGIGNVSGSLENQEVAFSNQAGTTTLEAGQQVLVNSTSELEVSVFYNRSFVSLTGVHKPDIVIRVKVNGEDPFLVVFDAKYRLYRSPSSGVSPGPEAINAMHRYKDAVMTADSSGRSRRLVRYSVALFPASAVEAEQYMAHPLHRSIHAMGVGAIPLLPANRTLLRGLIDDIFDEVRRSKG